MNNTQLYKEVGLTYFASFNRINNLLEKQSDIAPGTTAEQWIKFDVKGFIKWINRETGLYWEKFVLRHDGVEVIQEDA